METQKKPSSGCDNQLEVKRLLLLAVENWHDTRTAENYVKQALSKAGNDLDVLIGAYRFFFYKHQPEIALSITKQILAIITAEENLPDQWLQLQPILIAHRLEPNIRLYINTYAAQSLILAQLGEIESAKIISQRVKEIDEQRESCATTVWEVINRSPDEEE